jgi:hypothetical protein
MAVTVDDHGEYTSRFQAELSQRIFTIEDAGMTNLLACLGFTLALLLPCFGFGFAFL